MSHSEKLIVALDVPGLDEAKKLVKTLSKAVRTFKIGKELFTSAGPETVRMVQAAGGRVFLDLKFHDIPNTVGAACEAAAKLDVFMLNVHAVGGRQMMTAAVQAVHKVALEAKRTPPKVLGVTVLTSLTDRDLKEIGIKGKVKEQVQHLALFSQQCGLDGVVASAQEIALVREVAGKNFLIVTPGVRPIWAAHGDQKRIVTPKEAVEGGADFIVVGRPITQQKDPLEAAQRILEEIG